MSTPVENDIYSICKKSHLLFDVRIDSDSDVDDDAMAAGVNSDDSGDAQDAVAYRNRSRCWTKRVGQQNRWASYSCTLVSTRPEKVTRKWSVISPVEQNITQGTYI